jgi:integrase
MSLELEDTQQYRMFYNSFRSEQTRDVYTLYLKKYMEFQGLDFFSCETNPRAIEQQIIDFIIKMKERGRGYGTLHNYVASILSFYKINDVVLNATKIMKFMPEQKRVNDRAYTHQEISKMLEIADERMRVVMLLLASTGMRIGAIPELCIGLLLDTDPHTDDQDNKNAHTSKKVIVYQATREEYYTFITHECKKAIDVYLDFRKRYGEKLSRNSLLVREQFDIRNQTAIRKPTMTRPDSLVFKLADLARRCGIRTKEKMNMKEGERFQGGSKRKEVPIAHGFRKFFTTQLVNSKVNPEIREMLLGHKIGLASCYYRPTEEEMLNEYMKAVNNLTINEENRLRKRVDELSERNKNNEFIIKGKLEETNKVIQVLRQHELDNVDVIATLSDKVDELSQKISLLKISK